DGTTESMPHPFHGKPKHEWCGHAAWWFIFRRSIITRDRKIRFPAGAHPIEDTVFSFLLFNQVRRYGEVDEPLVHYRQHDAMVTKLSEGPKRESYVRSAAICLDRLAWFAISNAEVRRLGKNHACGAYMHWLIGHATSINQAPLKLAMHTRLLLYWWQSIHTCKRVAFPRIRERIGRFLLQRKVTRSGRVTIKLCKIPLLSLRIKERGFACWLAHWRTQAPEEPTREVGTPD
ncbi:MAG TPA: hypothetical protein VFY13_01915, partial [Luteolibacter sp.]|nr:hypothetical protein [Luteolibacter sp.]